MPSTGKKQKEGTPHTLGCFGIIRPITGWCDMVFGAYLCGGQCTFSLTCSKPWKCQMRISTASRLVSVMIQSDLALCWWAAPTLSQCHRTQSTQACRKIYLIIFIWQLTYLEKQLSVLHSFVTWLNTT